MAGTPVNYICNWRMATINVFVFGIKLGQFRDDRGLFLASSPAFSTRVFAKSYPRLAHLMRKREAADSVSLRQVVFAIDQC